jgi:hypothetical protein
MSDESLTVTRAGIVARGLGVYAILAVVSVIAAILYSGWETKQAIAQLGATMTAEHHSLRLAQDKTSCILALTIEERAAFRLRYQQGSFRQWCPWMGE